MSGTAAAATVNIKDGNQTLASVPVEADGTWDSKAMYPADLQSVISNDISYSSPHATELPSLTSATLGFKTERSTKGMDISKQYFPRSNVSLRQKPAYDPSLNPNGFIGSFDSTNNDFNLLTLRCTTILSGGSI